ncbi:hypothetical protein KSX_16970 [Ktedonospora formicarum]|uniref:Uncharacterized protein n=1 Tax=Ktedonospora formicarum TaxID=2778364 RepID=A0A8J3I0Y8_9CHLR|nr:hypothetical protein KSX_16970 [Ktedonospora formicarum]
MLGGIMKKWQFLALAAAGVVVGVLTNTTTHHALRERNLARYSEGQLRKTLSDLSDLPLGSEAQDMIEKALQARPELPGRRTVGEAVRDIVSLLDPR